MSRRSLALFLATTGLITSLTACGGGQEANEKGGDDTPSGQTTSPSSGSDDDGDKHDKRDGAKDHKDDEGGEGGEGGEG
jgi:hypothetical protein